jgi:hypothetical protein
MGCIPWLLRSCLHLVVGLHVRHTGVTQTSDVPPSVLVCYDAPLICMLVLSAWTSKPSLLHCVCVTMLS